MSQQISLLAGLQRLFLSRQIGRNRDLSFEFWVQFFTNNEFATAQGRGEWKMSRSEMWPAVRFATWTLLALLLVTLPFSAQTTISTGSIVGTVTDPSGAVVSGAKVTITNKGTGQLITTTTTSTGNYASGALIPGDYQVRIEGQGFKTAELGVVVQINTTTSGNVTLDVGQSAQVVEVQASELAVNTEQATVQGVLTARQIENLPING